MDLPARSLDGFRLKVNEESGYASVDLGAGWIRLRRPKFGQWVDWTGHLLELTKRLSTAGLDLAMAEELITAGPATAFNYEMIRTLAGVVLPPAPDAQLALALADIKLATELLNFWWECPIAPWDLRPEPVVAGSVPTAPLPSRRRDSKQEERQLTTGLTGALGIASLVYQALAVVGMGSGWLPPDINELEIFHIAILMGKDRKPGEEMDAGGELVRRGDGQVDRISFGRDPDQPLLFGPGSNPREGWAWLMRKRAQRQRQAQEAQGKPVPRPRRRRRWRL